MGKPKKGKKARQDDDFGDDDAVVDPIAQAEAVEPAEDVAPKSGKKGKGKKGKKADDDWADDVAKEIEALSLGKEPENTNNVEESKPVSAKSKKKDKKKKQKAQEQDEEDEEDLPLPPSKGKGGMSAFTMLDIEDVEDEDEVEEEEEEEVKPVSKKNKKNKKPKVQEEEVEHEEEASPAEEPAEPPPQSQSKKGGKKEKKKAEDEDIDAILADIDKPAEKPEGKKKKKKKEKLDDFPAADEEPSTGFELVDIESMTQEQIAMLLGGDDDEDDKKKKKKEKKKKKKAAEAEEKEDKVKEEEELGEKAEEGEKEDGLEAEEGTVKTAAQKKKEKRERQKQQKLLEKQKQANKQASGQKDEEPDEKPEGEPSQNAKAEAQKSDGEEEDDTDKKKSKKDRRKKKGAKEEEEKEKDKKKKPGNKQLKAMQDALQRVKEEEEAMRLAEEEQERKLEEARKAKEEAARIEAEKKEREKQKKKEKIERQKREGTFKTKAQKEAEKRAREMLAARGLDLPPRPASGTPGEGEPKRKRIVYDNRRRKNKQQQQDAQEVTSPTTEVVQSPEAETPTPSIEEKMIVEETPKEEEKEEEVLDSWELVEEKLEEEEKAADETKEVPEVQKEERQEEGEEDEEEEEDEEDEEDESSEEESSEEESSSEEDSEDEGLTSEEKAYNKAERRIKRRRDLAESKRNKENLRAPVVCVLGHVDTGKTKILDKLRRTNVQDGEAGGITQQIGATNVPHEAIREKTSMCKEFSKKELLLPGLLIIDTPGHESFSNLRNRGSSLCDIAILVVDIMHGLEPQTIESINLLKKRKTPFVVALNKIDRLFGWKPNPHSDVVNTLKKQTQNTKLEFEERCQMIQVQFAEQGLNTALFHENKNAREYISLCPTSAHSGDGMGNLVALICELSQTFLADKVAFIDDLQASVMEVKALPGLGMTIDVILVNGSIREGSTIVVAGTEGPIVTQIRGLLMPQPMKELRVKGAYIHQKEVKAAQGVKIIAKDLDKALAGLPLYVARYDDEIQVYRDDLEQSLEAILQGIKVQQEGVFVQASTLGSLEALLEFLRTSKIPYAGINIGPVHKRDIMRASVMLERDNQYAVILAFDVKVERDAQEMADNLGVRIFTADIIYHLFDSFMAYRAELKRQKQEEYKFIAVFPCKLRVLPNCVFNSRDPIVVGVVVEAGFIKEGTPLCVPSKEFIEIGRVTSIENNHKPVERASKGNEVCIKIEPIPGDSPKLYGRHFDHTDLLMSKISRQSIDAVKQYFREEMSKNDWQLIMEMKKLFEIL